MRQEAIEVWRYMMDKDAGPLRDAVVLIVVMVFLFLGWLHRITRDDD